MVKTKKISLVIAFIFIIPVLFVATASMAVTVTVQNSGRSSVSTTYYTQGGDHASGGASLVNGTVNVTTSGSAERGLIRTQGGDGSRDFCPFTGAFEAGGTATGDSASATSSCTNPRVNIFIVTQNPDHCQNCCASVYDKIQDAAADTPGAGDSWVLVDEGTYQENVRIDNKDNMAMESVWGAADTIINGQPKGGSTLYAPNSSDLSIRGFTITGGEGSGIYVRQYGGNADNPCIVNNIIKGNSGSGIYLSGPDNGKIISNTIEENGGTGIYLFGAENTEIIDNKITGNGSNDESYGGIRIRSGSAELHQNNIFGNDSYGLWNNTSNNITAENNWWGQEAPPTYQENLGYNNRGAPGTDIWDRGSYVDYTPWATNPY